MFVSVGAISGPGVLDLSGQMPWNRPPTATKMSDYPDIDGMFHGLDVSAPTPWLGQLVEEYKAPCM